MFSEIALPFVYTGKGPLAGVFVLDWMEIADTRLLDYSVCVLLIKDFFLHSE